MFKKSRTEILNQLQTSVVTMKKLVSILEWVEGTLENAALFVKEVRVGYETAADLLQIPKYQELCIQYNQKGFIDKMLSLEELFEQTVSGHYKTSGLSN